MSDTRISQNTKYITKIALDLIRLPIAKIVETSEARDFRSIRYPPKGGN